MLRHARVLRPVEHLHVHGLGARQDAAHVGQALEGDVLVRVPRHHQAGLVDPARQGFHRVRAQRPQHVAGPAQPRQGARLLQLPRDVGACVRADRHGGVDQPRGTGALDHRGDEGAQGPGKRHRQPVQQPVHHVEGDDVADARDVGGGAHHQVAPEGHPQGSGARQAEVVQDRVRRELPVRLQGHPRQCRVPLAGPVEGDDVEGTGGEALGEPHDLLGVAVEAVHHDEGGRRVGEAGAVRRVRLPSHCSELAVAVGHSVPGQREAPVRLVEGGRHGADEAALAGVVHGQVEGGQGVQAPCGRRVPLGLEARGQAPGELRDLAGGADALSFNTN